MLHFWGHTANNISVMKLHEHTWNKLSIFVLHESTNTIWQLSHSNTYDASHYFGTRRQPGASRKMPNESDCPCFWFYNKCNPWWIKFKFFNFYASRLCAVFKKRKLIFDHFKIQICLRLGRQSVIDWYFQTLTVRSTMN